MLDTYLDYVCLNTEHQKATFVNVNIQNNINIVTDIMQQFKIYIQIL